MDQPIVGLDQSFPQDEDLGREVKPLAIDEDEGEAFLGRVVDLGNVAQTACAMTGVTLFV